MPTGVFRAIAKFQDANGDPLTGVDYHVRLLDEDRFFDDKLGSSTLDSDGTAEFMIYVSDIKSIDSPDERTPDIYFVVTKNSREIFRSEVFSEVNFEAADPVTGRPDGLTQTFGPFQLLDEPG